MLLAQASATPPSVPPPSVEATFTIRGDGAVGHPVTVRTDFVALLDVNESVSFDLPRWVRLDPPRQSLDLPIGARATMSWNMTPQRAGLWQADLSLRAAQGQRGFHVLSGPTTETSTFNAYEIGQGPMTYNATVQALNATHIMFAYSQGSSLAWSAQLPQTLSLYDCYAGFWGSERAWATGKGTGERPARVSATLPLGAGSATDICTSLQWDLPFETSYGKFPDTRFDGCTPGFTLRHTSVGVSLDPTVCYVGASSDAMREVPLDQVGQPTVPLSTPCLEGCASGPPPSTPKAAPSIMVMAPLLLALGLLRPRRC